MATNFTFKERTETGWDALHPKTNMEQVEGLTPKINEVEAIAKGASKAKVFDTITELDAWLAVAANKTALNVGDNLYIRDVDTPDYWWDGTAKQPLETQKTALNNASTTADGLMSKEDKTKLNGLSNYTHPNTSGNKHIPSGGASGQILRYSADGTAVWGAENNTTYSAATASADGLMSKADKTRIDAMPTITAGTAEPANAKTGDLWYDFNNN